MSSSTASASCAAWTALRSPARVRPRRCGVRPRDGPRHSRRRRTPGRVAPDHDRPRALGRVPRRMPIGLGADVRCIRRAAPRRPRARQSTRLAADLDDGEVWATWHARLWRPWYAAAWAESASLAGRPRRQRARRPQPAGGPGQPVARTIVERTAAVAAGDGAISSGAPPSSPGSAVSTSWPERASSPPVVVDRRRTPRVCSAIAGGRIEDVVGGVRHGDGRADRRGITAVRRRRGRRSCSRDGCTRRLTQWPAPSTPLAFPTTSRQQPRDRTRAGRRPGRPTAGSPSPTRCCRQPCAAPGRACSCRPRRGSR